MPPLCSASQLHLPEPQPSSLSQNAAQDPPRRGGELNCRIRELLPALRRRARSLTRSRADLEDLLQDTLLRALEFEGSYHAGTNLRAWLNQILFSVFVMRYRRTRRERRILLMLERDPCGWVGPEQKQTLSYLTPRLRAALDALPLNFGVVVRLVDLDELSYRDAASRLDIPVGTVMSRLSRGRRMLAEQLATDRIWQNAA